MEHTQQLNFTRIDYLFEKYHDRIYRYHIAAFRSEYLANLAVLETFRMNKDRDSHIIDQYELSLKLFNCAAMHVKNVKEKMQVTDFENNIVINELIENPDEDTIKAINSLMKKDLITRQVLYLYNVEEFEINEIANILELLNYDVKEIIISKNSAIHRGGKNERWSIKKCF